MNTHISPTRFLVHNSRTHELANSKCLLAEKKRGAFASASVGSESNSESTEAEVLFPIIQAVLFLVTVCHLWFMRQKAESILQLQGIQNKRNTGLSKWSLATISLGTSSIPVQGCSLAAAAGMDSHEEGEWSTVWCYRRCSPSPPSLIPLLLALPSDRGSLSWPATRRLLRRGLRDSECDSVPGWFLTARNTVWCRNLGCPSHFCSARASGFGLWSSGWGSSSLWSDSSGAFEPAHWCLNGIEAKEGIKHQNSCTCEHIQ